MLEDWFQGAPLDGFDTLARRPFSFYMTSQVSYFVNDLYVLAGTQLPVLARGGVRDRTARHAPRDPARRRDRRRADSC